MHPVFTLSLPMYMVAQQPDRRLISHESPNRQGKAAPLFTERSLAEEWLRARRALDPVILHFPDYASVIGFVSASRDLHYVQLNPGRDANGATFVGLKPLVAFLQYQSRRLDQ